MYDYDRYKTYIASSEWKKKADIIKELDGNCLVCHWIRVDAEYPEVHHLIYERLFHERMTDLVTLCQACHNDVTLEWKSGKSLDDALEIVCSRFRNSVAKLKSKLQTRHVTDEARSVFGLEKQSKRNAEKKPKTKKVFGYYVVSRFDEHVTFRTLARAQIIHARWRYSVLREFKSRSKLNRWLKSVKPSSK